MASIFSAADLGLYDTTLARNDVSNPQLAQIFINSADALDMVRREADGVRTVEAYRDWVRDVVRLIFPHERLVSGFGYLHAGGVSIDYVVTVDFPIRYIQQLRNRAGAIECPMLRRWLAVGEPQLFEADRPWPDAPPEWIEVVRQNDVTNIAAHSVIDAEACLGTYHSFHCIPGRLGAWHIEGLKRIVPIMDHVLRRVIGHLHADGGLTDRLATLSAREMEIAQWVKMGKANGDIAQLLAVSENTVKHHVTNIFQKVGVENRVQLLQRLLEHEGRTAPGLATRIF